MKKLLALLMACTAMTCVFASCGDKKEDGSENDTSVSETESASVETTTSESTEVSDADSSAVEPATVNAQPASNEYIEDADKTLFVGKWECSRLSANGEDLDELYGIPTYAVFQYELHEDGTVSLPDSLMEASNPEDMLVYTWGMLSENEIEIVGTSESLNNVTKLTLKDGQLINIDEELGEEIYLDKVDEFQYFDFKAYYDAAQQQQQPEYVLTPVETDADGNIIEDTETVTAE